MRLFLAAVVCRLLRFIGRLVGKGSSLPGKYALKICPDVLGRVKLPPCVIAVTGSNGDLDRGDDCRCPAGGREDGGI